MILLCSFSAQYSKLIWRWQKYYNNRWHWHSNGKLTLHTNCNLHNPISTCSLKGLLLFQPKLGRQFIARLVSQFHLCNDLHFLSSFSQYSKILTKIHVSNFISWLIEKIGNSVWPWHKCGQLYTTVFCTTSTVQDRSMYKGNNTKNTHSGSSTGNLEPFIFLLKRA